MYNQSRSKNRTSSKVHRTFHFSTFFYSIDKQVNALKLHQKFNINIKCDSLTNVSTLNSSRKNENLIDYLFSCHKFMKHKHDKN
jgi:hypothetical protein